MLCNWTIFTNMLNRWSINISRWHFQTVFAHQVRATTEPATGGTFLSAAIFIVTITILTVIALFPWSPWPPWSAASWSSSPWPVATSTMVIITTIFVQFKRVLGQGRDGERLLCFVLWSLLCLQVGWGCVCLCVYLCLRRLLESAVSSGLKLLFRRNGQRNEGQFFLPKSFHVCANESECTATCIKFGFGKSRNVECSLSTVYLAGRPWVRTTPMPSSAAILQGAKTIFIVIIFWWRTMNLLPKVKGWKREDICYKQYTYICYKISLSSDADPCIYTICKSSSDVSFLFRNVLI